MYWTVSSLLLESAFRLDRLSFSGQFGRQAATDHLSCDEAQQPEQVLPQLRLLVHLKETP
jgi:hypothetical protein